MWRGADPAKLVSDGRPSSSLLPVLVLIAIVGGPPLVLAVIRLRGPHAWGGDAGEFTFQPFTIRP